MLISKICWIFLSTIYWLNLSCYSLVTKARDTQNVKIFCETYSTKDINLKYRSIKILHPTILLNWEQFLTGYFEKSSVPFMQLFLLAYLTHPAFHHMKSCSRCMQQQHSREILSTMFSRSWWIILAYFSSNKFDESTSQLELQFHGYNKNAIN